ncbi:Flp pilus assembly protein TadG [Cognatiyoonia sediminum]|uniref:Flp pilus assembly protein TadG n=2 Tax=Cognatiyoonia sediminum TaxID=1508389 RepID=A0A1M5N2W7_9RHOB|nr:Flp pilus assembly protein TadG [Cognatiyoonia sediminum]
MMKKMGEGSMNDHIQKAAKFCRRFREDESGSMTFFIMFIIVLTLIVAGMAVDFMKFESRRTIMQGAVDRAVLAAADLDQVRDPAEVVRDYVAKSQGGNCLSADPQIIPGANFRSVTANCELTMATYFLRILGMETLTAAASATAVEGVGNVEVSLVLDISGSMSESVPSLGMSKMDVLHDAGTAFVDALLQEEYEDRISVSLIPYTAHVNAGAELFDAYGIDRRHYFSNCVVVPTADFGSTSMNVGPSYSQAKHFQRYTGASYTCPVEDFEEIIPISQNADALKAAINQFEPRSTTSIFLGLKWGAALLDPSFQSVYSNLPSSMRDSAFSGRPENFGDNDNPSDTKKYIVVMTDGKNVGTRTLYDNFYQTPSMVAHWGAGKTPYDMYVEEFNGSANRYWDYYGQYEYTTNQGNTLMANICGAAKEAGIIIFAVAMGEGNDIDSTAMSNCASSPSGHYFETSGDELVAIFEAIADQITDLRLTL